MRGNSQSIAVIGLLVVSFIGLTIGRLILRPNCGTESVLAEKTEVETKIAVPEYDSSIESFGLGVYYFPQTGNNFGESLGLFLSCNTNLEVSAVAGEVVRQNRFRGSSSCDYGATIGYFVTFREKK